MVQMKHLLMAIQHQMDTVSVDGLSPLDETADIPIPYSPQNE